MSLQACFHTASRLKSPEKGALTYLQDMGLGKGKAERPGEDPAFRRHLHGQDQDKHPTGFLCKAPGFEGSCLAVACAGLPLASSIHQLLIGPGKDPGRPKVGCAAASPGRCERSVLPVPSSPATGFLKNWLPPDPRFSRCSDSPGGGPDCRKG